MPLVKSTETGEMVSTTEAGRMLGVTRNTVTAMAERGEIRGARRIGRNWQIPLEEVRKQLGEQVNSTQPEPKKEVVA